LQHLGARLEGTEAVLNHGSRGGIARSTSTTIGPQRSALHSTLGRLMFLAVAQGWTSRKKRGRAFSLG
jgi:hypothetical protein